jgi:hypothetical protein
MPKTRAESGASLPRQARNTHTSTRAQGLPFFVSFQ